MNVKKLNNDFVEVQLEIPYCDADELFSLIYKDFKHHFLMESKQVSLFSGRFSLIGLDATLRLSGKNENFSIEPLNDRGPDFLKTISPDLHTLCDSFSTSSQGIEGSIDMDNVVMEEHLRSQKKNITLSIRCLLEIFASDKKTLMGLYGAFSYDFIRLFEDLGMEQKDNDVPDFHLLLFDSFLFFDHIKEKTFIIVQRKKESDAFDAIRSIQEILDSKKANKQSSFSVTDLQFSLTQKDFEKMVRQAQHYIQQGDLFQVVFSNILKARFAGDPFMLYQSYRQKNPSPYLFYFEFGHEQLVGASPEMMVRCEDGRVHLRPIAGTIHRGDDPIDDHDQMLDLLSNPKERAELDMLIDLGRNDLSRICKPGIQIDDYRFVERYSRVMHTVAHLSGELRDGFCGLDALISCMNAGTLTGAPKVQAMKTIAKHEQERRGYYGGAFGQLTFFGDVDTTIMIRTAHIHGQELRYQSGAGIVYDSDPEKEYRETLHKAQAFFDVFSSSHV